jgi:hypothetical protein
MGIFDSIRDIFDQLFGDKEIDIFSWGEDNSDTMHWSPDVGEGIGDYSSLEERFIDDATGGEFVQEFYDLQGALDYVEGTPENVLMLLFDAEQQVYYVYRFPSE